MSRSPATKFLAAVRQHKLTGAQNAVLGGSASSGEGGGFFLPTPLVQPIKDLVKAASVVWQRCTHLPMPKSLQGLLPSVNESSRVDGSRMGGVSSSWLAEGGTLTACKPAWKRADIRAKKLGIYVPLTSELMEDTDGWGELVVNVAASEFAYRGDQAVVRGNGVQAPLGVLNAPATIEVTKETGQAADTIVAENILAMVGRFDVRSWGNAAWFVNMDVLPQLYSMALVVGGGGVPVFDMASTTLMGRPVIPIEQCSTVGTVGDIILADMSQYYILDARMRVNASIHVAYLTDEHAFRFIWHVDGQPLWSSPITPANGSSTVSPFVVLESRD